MNILVLAPHPFFQNRGTPIAVRMLVDALTASGHRVDVLTYHEGEDVPIPRGTLYRIRGLPGVRGIDPGFSVKKLICDALMFLKCLSLVRAMRYDLLHAVEESAFIALCVKRFSGIPFVYDMDSSLAQQMMERFEALTKIRWFMEGSERVAIRGSLGVVAVCKSLEELVKGCDPDKLVVRLEDITLLRSGGTREHMEDTDLGIPEPCAMYVGNLEAYQGIDLLLESMCVVSELKQEGNLVIIGGKEEHIARYRRRSSELGIEDRVFLVGPRPIEQLGEYLNQADVLVSPRIKGYNTPMKIYSYLDSGKPLLATRLLTHTQVLDDEIAYLVDPEPEAMGAGLVRLFQDRDLARSLAQRAKDRVEREFTLEAYERKLIGFYETVEDCAIGESRA